jgi:hypothetical protein
VTLPAFIIEFSPGEAPFDTPSWVNISTRVVEASWKWGRDNELERFDSGVCTLKLTNQDRLFDPEYTAGTYFGLLTPRVPFRIRTSTKDLFYGFVQNGWQQVYEPPSNAYCIVELTDLLDVVAREVLPQSAFEVEVLADSAKAFWRLDETDGTVMGDSSGNGNNGLYDNALVGDDPLVIGSIHSINFPHVGDNRGEFKGEALPLGPPASIEAWFRTDRDLAAYKVLGAIQRDASGSISVGVAVGFTSFAPNGEVNVRMTGIQARGDTRVDDGRIHHVVVTFAGTSAGDLKIYVDGTEETLTIFSGSAPNTWPASKWWTVGNTLDFASGDFGFDGNVDEFAVYNTALSAARVLAHYNAGATAFNGESSGARIGRVLDLVGVPAGMRSIATGDTFMGPAKYEGARVGDYLRGVVESEQGYLYVDHANGGKLTFKGRYSRFTDSRSTSSQATFTDASAASPAYRYERGQLKIEPNGMQTIINRVEVDWVGGTEVVAPDPNPPYGPQSRRIRTEAPSPVAAQSAGLWMITRFSEAQTRVRGLGINPGASVAVQTPALDLRVGDKVTVVRQPQSIGTATTNVLIVEGVKHKTAGLKWETSYSFSDADTSDVWIWGTSAWNTDTFWG